MLKVIVLSFARKFGGKYGKTLMDTATKTGIEAAKTASKRVVQNTAEATRYLIWNEIAYKTTSIGKPKVKEKTRNLYSTSKKTTNYWWLEFILKNVTLLYKNGISINCKLSSYNFW